MVDIDDSSTAGKSSGRHRVSVFFLLAAAGVFLCAAALQLLASLQRWVGFRQSLSPNEILAEDGRYDYSFPIDPWENVGTAAEQNGPGMLLVALGTLLVTTGVMTHPGIKTEWSRAACEAAIATLVAGAFALHGTHALLSGSQGSPSALQSSLWVWLIGAGGLVALAALWRRRSRAAVLTCVFLLGTSGVGALVAALLIAPLIAGGMSHDTTPWTETVIAAFTALAGMAVACLVARGGFRSRPQPEVAPK